eukprot:4852877-Lingulodinium_polyedra.AAC.1
MAARVSSSERMRPTSCMGTGATGARSARSMSPELRAMWAGPRARGAGSEVRLGGKLHASMARV